MLGLADGAKLLSEMEANGKIVLVVDGENIALDSEDIEVRLQAKDGWAAAQGRGTVVVLATELTPELIREGMARDVVRLVQDHRKELDLNFTDRIVLGLVTQSDELATAIVENTDYIKQETLAVQLVDQPIDGVLGAQREVAGQNLTIYIRVFDRH